ncbi:hypothetical protein SFRURICE_011622 [Spodoptera frugiperda]|nr:hypothetical protein SFRURICE_011622 [Spodoptera frugiperda]
MIDLFGSCCCYQIIIAKSIKQLVENVPDAKFEGKGEGYPNLRVYLMVMIPMVILICLIRHLKYLAPFSIAANVLVAFCVVMVVYYAMILNPTLQGMETTTSIYGMLEYVGIGVFSMSCSGVVIPIENNMAEPRKFPIALTVDLCAEVLSLDADEAIGKNQAGHLRCSRVVVLDEPEDADKL